MLIFLPFFHGKSKQRTENSLYMHCIYIRSCLLALQLVCFCVCVCVFFCMRTLFYIAINQSNSALDDDRRERPFCPRVFSPVKWFLSQLLCTSCVWVFRERSNWFISHSQLNLEGNSLRKSINWSLLPKERMIRGSNNGKCGILGKTKSLNRFLYL